MVVWKERERERECFVSTVYLFPVLPYVGVIYLFVFRCKWGKLLYLGYKHHYHFCAHRDIYRQRMRNIVERVLEYCGGDLPSIVYLCQSYTSPIGRAKTLCGVIAFHQLCLHLKLNKFNFVTEVQVIE